MTTLPTSISQHHRPGVLGALGLSLGQAREVLEGPVSTSPHAGSAQEYRRLFAGPKPKQLFKMKTPLSGLITENSGYYTCTLICLLFF